MPPQLTILAARFHPDRHGGVETHMLHLARTLAEHGQSVRVLTENRTSAPEREILYPGLEVKRFPQLRSGPFWRWPTLPRLAWWFNILRRETKQTPSAHPLSASGSERAGVRALGSSNASDSSPLWATDPLMAVAALLAGRRRDLIYNPAACTAAMRQVGSAYPHVSTMRRPRLLTLLDRLAYRAAPRVVVSSQNLADQYTYHFGQRPGLHVVPLGVDLPTQQLDREEARNRLNIPPRAFTVGFVGRLDPCKDLGFLFHSLATADLPADARLLLVGDGPDRQRLESLAASLHISHRITWTGSLADPSPAYAAMDAFVLPSVYEAFGSVVLEAMAHGLPVLARARYDWPDQPVLTASAELIADSRNGYVVGHHSAAELSRRLADLARSPILRHSLSLTARATAARYPWSRNAMTSLTIARDPEALEIPLLRAAA